MAERCFCGCGRKVRLASRRLSGWGADAQALVRVLEVASIPATEHVPDERRMVETLIEHGRQFEMMFREMVHGDSSVPVGASVDFRRQWENWQQAATRAAREHRERLKQR